MSPLKKRSSDWPAKAGALAGTLALKQLHPAALAWASRRGRADAWCVAFSGGADSLALLLLLWAHWPERRANLVALHFNHRLRGRSAEADERFCRTVCAGLKIPLRVGRWRRHSTRPPRGAAGVVSEAEARAARHAFFEKELARVDSRALWLAHQQDDIAESMLMRVARGSGTAGLAAPRPVQIMGAGRVHVRPLLTLKKSELMTALRQVGARWREDASNGGTDFFRNRIRHAVIPAWQEAAGRDAAAGAALARERLQEDDEALETWVDTLRVVRRGRLNVAALAGQPRAVARRSLHRWLLTLAMPVDLSRQGFEALLAAVERGAPTRFSLSRDGFAVIAGGELRFRRR